MNLLITLQKTSRQTSISIKNITIKLGIVLIISKEIPTHADKLVHGHLILNSLGDLRFKDLGGRIFSFLGPFLFHVI